MAGTLIARRLGLSFFVGRDTHTLSAWLLSTFATSMETPRLDRTAFRAGSFAETEEYYRTFWRAATPAERLRAAHYFNSVAYGFDLNNPPPVDRTAFRMGRMADRSEEEVAAVQPAVRAAAIAYACGFDAHDLTSNDDA